MEIRSVYPIIATNRLEETIKFYEKMGFSVKHTLTTKMWSKIVVISNEKDLDIELFEINENSPKDMQEGIYGLRMNVDDLDKALAEFKANGATILSDPIPTESGFNAFIKDNNGVNITLIKHIKK